MFRKINTNVLAIIFVALLAIVVLVEVIDFFLETVFLVVDFEEEMTNHVIVYFSEMN